MLYMLHLDCEKICLADTVYLFITTTGQFVNLKNTKTAHHFISGTRRLLVSVVATGLMTPTFYNPKELLGFMV